jgi:dTDP-4-amino-4,6-dideoxygalactose transaminase
MKIKRISQVGAPLSWIDLGWGFQGMIYDQKVSFAKALADFLTIKNIYLTNSGLTAFYLILQALQESSSKKEVILPAYTAPSLVLPIIKAGLKPVLCDISAKDFNIDLSLVPGAVTNDTLAIVMPHMFGFGVAGIEKFKKSRPDIYVIEDCAQAWGTKINNQPAGTFSDISFFSFNRGKNLPTYGGGCIATRNDELAARIEIKLAQLPPLGLGPKISTPFKIMAFSLANQPYVYGLGYSLIAKFKDNTLPQDFPVGPYSSFQAGVGIALLKKAGEFSQQRLQHARTLIEGLKNTKGIITPEIYPGTEPAVLRLPVLFKDVAFRDKVEKALDQNKIDTSRLYVKPIHQFFSLGYGKEDFPVATGFAEKMLTLPVHPLVTEADLEIILKIIQESAT